jgi:phosphocarrier protein
MIDSLSISQRGARHCSRSSVCFTKTKAKTDRGVRTTMMELYKKEIESPVDIHGRSALRLNQKANEFREEIYLEDHKGRRVSAKSLLGMLSLGIKGNDKFQIYISDKASNPESTITQLLEALGGGNNA